MNHETVLLLNLAAKMTAILLAGFALASFLRRSSAANRSLLWLVVFGVLALLPVSIWTRPVWSWSLPATHAPRSEAAVKPVAAAKPKAQADPFAATVPDKAPETQMEQATGLKFPSAWQTLAAVYFLGVIVVLARRLAGEWQMRRLKMLPAEPRVEVIVKNLVEELAIRRPVRVFFSPHSTVPMAWGVLRPVVILPQESRAWSDEALMAAIRHEIAHIHHHDMARRWLTTLVTAFCWSHPLVWMAARQWKLDQERACDDFVLAAGSPPESYARQLLEVAKCFQPGAWQSGAALVMAMPFGLESRIRAVVDASVSRGHASRGFKTMAVALGMAAASLCALCHAQNDPAKNTGGQTIEISTKFFDQIVISTKFVEVDTTKSGVMPDALKKAMTEGNVVLSDKEFQELIGELSQKKGIDLMSTPTVTTKPAQEARMEVVREFIYPTELEMTNEVLTPTTFELTPVGVMADVKPDLKADGTIQIKPMTARVTEFDGFITGGVENLVPNGKDKWKVDLSKKLVGREKLMPKRASLLAGVPSADKKDDINKLRLDGLKKDEISLPQFSIQEWEGEASLKPGEWQVSYLKRLSGDPKLHEGRHVWCLVSAAGIVAQQTKIAPDPDQAKTPITIDSQFIEVPDDGTFEKAFGTMSPDGPPVSLAQSVSFTGIFTPEQHQRFMKELSATKDCRVLSSPRVITLSGRKAVVEVGQEIEYPTAFSADGKKVEKTDRRRAGFSLEATPTLVGGGAVELEILPSVTELHGWKLAGRDELLGEEPKDSGPYTPMFSSRQVKTSVTVWPQQRIVMSLGEVKDGKRMLCLIGCYLGKDEADAAVTVLGQVKRQGKYNHKPGMMLNDLLKEAQGMTDKASALEICRGKGDAEKRIKLDPLKDGTTPLLPGDTVIVE